MQPSEEQIEAAARLVVGHVVQFPMQPPKVFIGDVDGIASCRDWQPWADTEAGSADWAVLDTAVYRWFSTVGHDSLQTLFWEYVAAMQSGDLNQRKAATFAAAVAIGAHKGEEGK